MKNLSLGVAFLLGVLNAVNAQSSFVTSESCDCVIDTAGLASYLSKINLSENNPLKFEVESNSSTFAVLHGVIGPTTPSVVNQFISNYPHVTTLVFMQVPGSMDDDSNLIASKALKNRGYKHYLPAVNAYSRDAFIASGGVDMFLAGDVRVVDKNGELGVHSWSDGQNDATHYPVGSAQHQPYIDYYIEMGFSKEDSERFYYYTINAAPASGIHLMTESEIEEYKMRTCKYAKDPVYTVSVKQDKLFANLAGASYQWVDCNNNNEPIEGANEQLFSPTSNGSYAVKITESECSGISSCTDVTTVGSEDLANFEVSIFPNPSNGIFQLRLPQQVSIRVYDQRGRLVKEIEEAHFSYQLELNAEPGVYFMEVRSDQYLGKYKLVKR